MTTLKIQNIACPHCRNKMYTIGVMSFITRNSEVFSDGKTERNPPTPNTNAILICSDCYKAFWKEDVIIENENYDDNEELPEAGTITDLFPRFEAHFKLKNAKYYLKLLENGFAKTTERKQYLRLKMWRTLNDIIRYNYASFSEEENAIFNENIIRLLEIFTPKNEEEKLLKVEMLREIGEFEKALLFRDTFKVQDNKIVYRQIMNRLYKNEAKVFEIKF